MLHRSLTMLAAIALLFSSTVATTAAKDDDRKLAFAEFDRLLPLATASADEKNAKAVRDALSEGKSPWLTIAAVEAVRQAELDKSNAGQVFLPEVLALMGKDHKKLHEEEIVPLNVIACLGVLATGDDDAIIKVVRAFIDWQRWSENPIVRLRHMVEHVLFDLTEEDCAFNTETLTFWEWWARNKESKQNMDDADKPPEKKSKTAPVIFKEPMVGTHVVFVIDVSDSMKWPIKEKDIAKIKAKTDHLDWEVLGTQPSPMDLAKAELVYSIDKLRPDKDANGKVKKGSMSKNDPEARQFAIVTYSTDIRMITEGWVQATDGECNTWMSNVEDFETEHMTNIHGALIEAFQLSDSAKKPSVEGIPVDKDCVLSGAHTVVFLTDGYPTWSMDTTEQSAADEWGRENQIGNGEYVKRDKLIELERTFNRFRKVVINTVGIGIHDKKLMMAFAKNSGGGYTDWECGIDYGQGK